MFTAVFCVFCPQFNPTIYHFGGFVQGRSQGGPGVQALFDQAT